MNNERYAPSEVLDLHRCLFLSLPAVGFLDVALVCFWGSLATSLAIAAADDPPLEQQYDPPPHKQYECTFFYKLT